MMHDEQDSMAVPSPDAGTERAEERPETHPEVPLGAELDQALATGRALSERLHAATRLVDTSALADIERHARALNALMPPKWLPVAPEAQRTLGMEAAYRRTIGLEPAITNALAGLERSVLARSTALSSQWLAGLALPPAAALASQIPSHALPAGLHEHLAEQFQRLTGPARDLERVLEGIELGQRWAAAVFGPTAAARQAWDAVAQLNAAALRTWDHLGARPDHLAARSPRLAEMPVVEVYAATQAATLVSAPEAAARIETIPTLEATLEEIGDAFEARLASLDPALMLMYRGGIERVEQGGTDWARQALTSFRELSTHTLHLLAPDDAVKRWAQPEHYDNGRLTRKARLEYIVREVASGDLVDFLKKDLASALALFDLMHTVHKKEPALDQRQLRLIHNRIRGVISALLEAAGR